MITNRPSSALEPKFAVLGAPDVETILPVPRPRMQPHPVVAEEDRTVHVVIPAPV